MKEHTVNGGKYLAPLQSFNKGSREDMGLLLKWAKHYNRLGIDTFEKHWEDGKTVELLVNKEQNDRVWEMECMVGNCRIDPPHPDFGIVDYASANTTRKKYTKKRGSKLLDKYVKGEV